MRLMYHFMLHYIDKLKKFLNYNLIISFKIIDVTERRIRQKKTPLNKPNYNIAHMNHSQISATFTVTSATGVLTMQHHITICNKYLKN